MSRNPRGWSGRTVTRARAHFTPMLPLPCARCGLPVDADMRWHVGHQLDRALGGGHELSNLWPEHARCSMSAGGKLAHALRRAVVPAPPPRHARRRDW